MSKIAVFNWGQLSIHTCYLVQQLAAEGFEVVLYVYTPHYVDRNSLVYNLIEDMRTIAKVVELRASFFESILIKLNRLIRWFKIDANLFCINPLLPSRTRKVFKPANYRMAITIAQTSLFWLYKCDAQSLEKTLHYSLEIFTVADPEMKKTSCMSGLVKAEQLLLPKTAGLIIQDERRAAVLLPEHLRRPHQQIIYLPVSVPGDIQREKSSFLHEKLNIPAEKLIVLYFGAALEERKIGDLVNAFAELSSDQFVLVLHGDPGFRQFLGLHKNVYVSSEWLPFSEIDKVVASAAIGICFYDNGWPNTRLTAFSSEKIARYTKAGVPFLAFENESYKSLKEEFNCCEMIKEMNSFDIEEKLQMVLHNYDSYRNESFSAFNKYYKIETSVKPLIAYIKGLNAHK